MSPDDEKLFSKIANDPKLRQQWLRDAKELMPDHPAVREQKILDDTTAPLFERINKLEEQLSSAAQGNRYESERSKMRTAPYNFNEKKIAELEERMARAAKEEGVVFDSYPHAAEYIRRMDMPLGPSTAAIGFDLGVQATGSAAGAEKWREDMQSTDPKTNPAMMSRRERKRYVRALAREASDDFKANLRS
jgi:hypothetical protein